MSGKLLTNEREDTGRWKLFNLFKIVNSQLHYLQRKMLQRQRGEGAGNLRLEINVLLCSFVALPRRMKVEGGGNMSKVIQKQQDIC